MKKPSLASRAKASEADSGLPDKQPVRQRTVYENARFQARHNPDACAFIDGGVRHDFASVLNQADRLAASLVSLGLKQGDVISFQLPNWHEAAIINLAACKLGLVCNPIVPIYRGTEVEMTLADSGSRAFFVPGVWRNFDYGAMARGLLELLPDLDFVIHLRSPGAAGLHYENLVASGEDASADLAEIHSDAVKLLMYTSGTTGRAKGVLHSHESLPAAVNRAAIRWGLEPGDTMLMPSPVTHVTGYCCGLEMPFEFGMSTVLMERWDAREAVSLIEEHQVNATVGATPFLQELVSVAEERQTRLPSLKVFACGGAAVPPDLVRRANRLLEGRVFRVYGSTEVPLVTLGITLENSPELGATTDGMINDYEVRLAPIDEGGDASGIEEGEILVRGAGCFLGYADAAQTQEAFTPDGYFRTGDIGVLGQGNTLTITGRKKDLIIRGGENISAKEIEDVLHQQADVTEAAAVAMPHPRMGETVCLYLVLKPGTEMTLDKVCEVMAAAGLARQKFPEHLEIVDELPHTASGKVRKDLLRRMIARKADFGSSAQSSGARVRAPADCMNPRVLPKTLSGRPFWQMVTITPKSCTSSLIWAIGPAPDSEDSRGYTGINSTE